MRNHSYENVFYLQVHFRVDQTYFHMKDFVQARTRFETEARGIVEMAHHSFDAYRFLGFFWRRKGQVRCFLCKHNEKCQFLYR